MKIAFVSYEYPPDTAYGGIATYVYQAARMLIQRGHYIEIFTASTNRCSMEIEDSILVHRIQVNNRTDFTHLIAPVFCHRHTCVKFDILEGPDCGSDAAGAVKLVKDIPLIIKLHTPSFILGKLNNSPMRGLSKTRFFLGAIRRGKLPNFPPPYDPQTDSEYLHILEADEIASPSLAIANKLVEHWPLDIKKVSHVPYPYIPSSGLLNIPIETLTNVVTFIGRLEVRKGILDLAKAIPYILQQFPQAKFRFVGPAWPSPKPKLDMQEYLELKLKNYRYALEFTGRVSLDQIPSFLANTDICVFPSIWESFGLVCAEAMSAGRGVVASSAGGMAELLNHGEVGRLVPPRSPQKTAAAVIELLENPTLRMRLGQAARDRILTEYNLERIATLQEASYVRAIEKRQALGKRVANNLV